VHEAIDSDRKGIEAGSTLYDHFLSVERCLFTRPTAAGVGLVPANFLAAGN